MVVGAASPVTFCYIRTLSCTYWSDYFDHVKIVKLICHKLFINYYVFIKWHGLVTRWTMHWPWTTQRVNGLILESILRLVWLIQGPVVQQGVPSVCGSSWLIVPIRVELSHLIHQEQQDQRSTVEVLTSHTKHMYLPI